MARLKAARRQAAAAAPGRSSTDALLRENRIEAVSYFWVPFSDDERATGSDADGIVLLTLPHERPYDLGSVRRNVRTALG